MNDLPKIGDRIKVWPKQGLRIQATATAFDDGGMALSPDGTLITWSEFSYRQLLHGEIHLHDTDTEAEQLEKKKIADEAEAKTKIEQAKAEQLEKDRLAKLAYDAAAADAPKSKHATK